METLSTLPNTDLQETVLEAFQWMYYSSRDRYTGQKNETSLKDQIEFTTDIKRRNKKKKYFDFFLLSN